MTEQNTSTSYCIHQGITKISPESISRSHGKGSAFLFVFLLLGCLLIVIIPLSSTSCLDTFQKAMHRFFFYFCKEPHSLMAFKTGSTTIKLKSENAHCRLSHFRTCVSLCLSLSSVLCLSGMHAQMLIHMHTDRLTFIHFTPCLEWLLYGIQIH